MFYQAYTKTSQSDQEGMECPYLDGNLIQNQQKRERTEEKEEEKISIPSSRLDTPLCRFFVLGKCRYGSLCTYSHQLPTFFSSNEEEDTSVHFGSMVACPFFLRGNCKYGDFCKLRHSNPSKRSNTQAINTQVTTILEYTCGICFDDIVASGKRFGLMNCDHCYCVDCLREWRQSKALERDVTRACPCCRMPSDYIVPSLNFCIGEEKKQVIQAYKQHLSRRECKYFNGNFGSCPFGRNCFYAHYNLQGINVKQMDVSKTKQEENQFQQNSNRSSSRTSTSNRTSTSTRLIRWFLGQEEEEEFVHPSSSIWPLYIDLYPRSYPRHDDDFFAFDDEEEEEEEEEEDLYNSDYYEHDDEEDDDEEECYYY